MSRCEGCYIELAGDARRCAHCGDMFVQGIASALVYCVTYFGALGLMAVGSYLAGLLVGAIGGLAFWRSRRRIREIRRLSGSGQLPRAIAVKHD
jgi:hypothetical protein